MDFFQMAEDMSSLWTALNGVAVKEVKRFLCMYVWVSACVHVRWSLGSESHDSELLASSWETEEMWEINSRQEIVSQKAFCFCPPTPLFVCYFELRRIHIRI